uniref:Uncharacterized protein n=1 Tax=Candidatus Kentrum sp. MB TaxID=2138164 RepID=A0A451B7V3_9GAMM|nr:MAG: hypothetical protein BECKMB1821G_GA0114241_100118 [Candidatus Kentron sp. MB]VFK27631.1 MAG: hypothetical protein BECKMB1821I_GA0114274_100418 [Candidatus Kentron sp. MB]VFK74370.1 MAG: hypothetical protein BECKMB1821H_GA0114242_100418 [Candidatus Kentron sp. MB]
MWSIFFPKEKTPLPFIKRYKTAMLAVVLTWGLGGCAINLESLDQTPCLDCRNLIDINIESFLRLAADSERSCIVHRYGGGNQNPSESWKRMLTPLRKLLKTSRMHLHLWQGDSPTARNRNVHRARALYALYQESGANRPQGSIYGGDGLFLPPYDGLCRNGPILELTEGLRLLSPRATPPLESDVARRQAENTIVVVIGRGR